MFEGSLEQQKGFIAIAAPYFTNGYCSAEPQQAAKKGKNCSITSKIEDKTNKEARFSVSTPIYKNICKNSNNYPRVYSPSRHWRNSFSKVNLKTLLVGTAVLTPTK